MPNAQLIAALAASALLAGCQLHSEAEARDAGPVTKRSIAVGAFDKIAVAGPYEVVVKTGGQPGVIAHGGENFLDETEIKVEDGTLKIGTKKRNIRWTWHDKAEKVRIEVSAAALNGAAIAGSGGMEIDKVAADDFEGEIAGSGRMTIADVQAKRAKFGIAGSGEVKAAGKAEAIDVSIAGSGDADLAAVDATDADVSIAGSGNVRARATGQADVSIMGSGDVEVTGGAKCNVSKQGSGNVRCS